MLMSRGYELVIPPVMVNERAMQGTGFFPLGREEAYAMPADGFFLVGTSEVPLVSLHCDETLDGAKLPIRYAGISACFRREAGAHGKDTRGLYRVHQFTKVEQVVFCMPDEAVAEKEHYALLGNAEAILEKLEIPYRVALACTGEIGLGQTRKHEVESWMPGRDAYCETHSCSTLGDFQSRRSNIRVRMPDGSLVLSVHAQQHRDREPAHFDSAPRESSERRRLGDAAEGARAVHERRGEDLTGLRVPAVRSRGW